MLVDWWKFFFSFFRIISSFLTDTLYQTSLVNHLFSFDLDKKLLLIKEKDKKIKNKFKDESQKIYSPNNSGKILPNNSFLNDELTINTKNKLNEEALFKLKKKNENSLLSKPKRKKKKKKQKNHLFPLVMK